MQFLQLRHEFFGGLGKNPERLQQIGLSYELTGKIKVSESVPELKNRILHQISNKEPRTYRYFSGYVRGSLFFLIHHREGKDKFRSHAFGADDVDVFVMRLDDLAGDGEAEAGALFIFAAG